MRVTELQEIKDYWTKKYPTVDVTLYPNSYGDRFYGKMMASNCSFDLNAGSVGDLISQGESFLRKVT